SCTRLLSDRDLRSACTLVGESCGNFSSRQNFKHFTPPLRLTFHASRITCQRSATSPFLAGLPYACSHPESRSITGRLHARVGEDATEIFGAARIGGVARHDFTGSASGTEISFNW